MGGLKMQQLDLSEVSSKAELQEVIAAAVAITLEIEAKARDGASGQWLLGWGWTESQWGGALPHASWIDSVRKRLSPTSSNRFPSVFSRF